MSAPLLRYFNPANGRTSKPVDYLRENGRNRTDATSSKTNTKNITGKKKKKYDFKYGLAKIE